VLDETGDVLLEQKLATTPKAMREVFGGMPRPALGQELIGIRNTLPFAPAAMLRADCSVIGRAHNKPWRHQETSINQLF